MQDGGRATRCVASSRRSARGVRVLHAPCIGRCEQAPAAVVGRNAIAARDRAKIVAAVDAREVEHPDEPYIGYAQYRAEGGYALLRNAWPASAR